MVRIFPLVAFLLIGLVVGATPTENVILDRDLPPGPRRRVMKLRKELVSIISPKCDRLLYVIQEIAWARMCLYNGLPFPEYKRLLAICRNRSESLDALRAYRKKCSSTPSSCDKGVFNGLMKARQASVSACKAIGWGNRSHCPNLTALKAEFEEIKDACKGKQDRVRTIRKEIKAVKTNFARPSTAPVARIAE